MNDDYKDEEKIDQNIRKAELDNLKSTENINDLITDDLVYDEEKSIKNIQRCMETDNLEELYTLLQEVWTDSANPVCVDYLTHEHNGSVFSDFLLESLFNFKFPDNIAVIALRILGNISMVPRDPPFLDLERALEFFSTIIGTDVSKFNMFIRDKSLLSSQIIYFLTSFFVVQCPKELINPREDVFLQFGIACAKSNQESICVSAFIFLLEYLKVPESTPLLWHYEVFQTAYQRSLKNEDDFFSACQLMGHLCSISPVQSHADYLPENWVEKYSELINYLSETGKFDRVLMIYDVLLGIMDESVARSLTRNGFIKFILDEISNSTTEIKIAASEIIKAIFEEITRTEVIHFLADDLQSLDPFLPLLEMGRSKAVANVLDIFSYIICDARIVDAQPNPLFDLFNDSTEVMEEIIKIEEETDEEGIHEMASLIVTEMEGNIVKLEL